MPAISILVRFRRLCRKRTLYPRAIVPGKALPRLVCHKHYAVAIFDGDTQPLRDIPKQ